MIEKHFFCVLLAQNTRKRDFKDLRIWVDSHATCTTHKAADFKQFSVGSLFVALTGRVYISSPIATHCNTLQHTATHCNTLQHRMHDMIRCVWHWRAAATYLHNCNTLQHTATHCNALQHTATHCNTLQHTATHYSTLQHTATHCDTLQHTATQNAWHDSLSVTPKGRGYIQRETVFIP